VRVEWDPEKDRANRIKHGLGFHEVRALFEGEVDHLVISDEEHSEDEDRFIPIGTVAKGVVAVAHSEPSEGTVRIISARMATRAEEALFRRHVRGRKR
jgi:hypothetical protein